MPKKVILIVVGAIVLIVVYNLVNQIFEAMHSGERLTQAADSLYKLQTENRQLQDKLAQINTPQFIEEQARDKLGLSKKGETVVIIPDDRLNRVLGISRLAPEVKLPNWLGWWRVFFR